MGTVGSSLYSRARRFVMRYNVEERTYKFLDKGNLPSAPRYKSKRPIPEVQLSREALEDIHCKNAQLNEYLKKVYLTSTSQITGTPSKRQKPRREDEELKKFMFYEPEVPAPGRCTLSNVMEILLNYEPNSKVWGVDAVAEKFKLSRKDVVLLVSYYTLYRHEKFDFLNQEAQEPEKIELEVNEQLEKRPLRKIDSK